MTRPIRIEFAGALYHITSRGDRREPIYEDDTDRTVFLQVLADVIARYNWICHAYCLMSNHYHLVIETPDGNLSKGMRQLNGVYTQLSNRRHQRTGHLFQGRYKGILVDSDAYLLELARYVVLNPVRAKMVKCAEDWPWSSYRAAMGLSSSPAWLETDGLLAMFDDSLMRARAAYTQFVLAGVGQDIWSHLKNQVYLGDENFVIKMQGLADERSDDINIPQAQRRPPAVSLKEIAETFSSRNEAMQAAWATGQYTYRQIGDYFGVHLTTVGRIVRSKKH